MSELDDLMMALGDARFRFWICPVEGHSDSRLDAQGVPAETVHWDGDIARCTWPGCGRTNEHPESYCHRCLGPNITWSAPSPLWNAVMRGGSINGTDEFDGIVCPTCFGELAGERGIARTWTLKADEVFVELETVTPSGRVWDDAAGRWRDPVGSSEVSDGPG